MKNLFSLRRFAACNFNQRSSFRLAGFRLFAGLAVALVAIGVAPHLVSQAQKSRSTNRVWNVSSQPAGAGTMVSIAADNTFGRAQNWQDGEGYHLVIPNTVAADSLKSIHGVKVRRVGTSLEVLFRTKPGSTVNLQAEGNEITLVVDKTLEEQALEREARNSAKSSEPHVADDAATAKQSRRDPVTQQFSSAVGDLAAKSNAPSIETRPPSTLIAQAGNGNLPAAPSSDFLAQAVPSQDAPSNPPASESASIQPEDALASIFSATSVFVIVALGLFGLLVSRKLRSRHAMTELVESPLAEHAEWVENQTLEGRIRVHQQPETFGAGEALVKSGGAALSNGQSRQSSNRMAVSGPTTLYGAYRIDQEVGKLILGQPHRMDVLGSRASDDRRAIETSLTKGVNSPELDESARRRAREALEEYGFVARQCATLLLAPDAFERTSAARSLGEIKSEAALPFLLESLYDSESIVRNQAVVSIGELKLPSAIGALLDIARTHPDVPSALLSRTLSACSVEGLDFFDAMPIEPAQLGTGQELSVIDQITHLEPASSVEELPIDSDNEQLTRALASLGSADVQERAEALKALAQFRFQSAVEALMRLARHDSEPNLRAVAIFSLGSIDHESVFAAILIGMADESREVRAAAARALNRLSFDRADAYVRVIETCDEETLCNVAKACIQAGIVSQNVDRLTSSDYRQAYETFSLICLLAKANMNEPILNVIAEHPNMDVRLKSVHLLAATGQPGIFEHLRQLAVRDGVGEEVKTSLLEAMYKLDQEAKRKENEAAEALEAATKPQVESPEVDIDEAADEFYFSSAPASQSDPADPEIDEEMEAQPDLDELEM
jgi:HEAT repeat protein